MLSEAHRSRVMRNTLGRTGGVLGIDYLRNKPWSSWTRDERFFCSLLYSHARSDAAAFARWLISTAGLKASPEGEWDLGFEVCFYRDYLWQLELDHRVHALEDGAVPLKRTFDLCLFGERAIIIVEAKVCEGFGFAQNEDFDRDRRILKSLPGLEQLEVYVVALASSKYYGRVATHGKPAELTGEPEALRVFDGKPLSWANVFEHFQDGLFKQADDMYGLGKGQLIADASS